MKDCHIIKRYIIDPLLCYVCYERLSYYKEVHHRPIVMLRCVMRDCHIIKRYIIDPLLCYVCYERLSYYKEVHHRLIVMLRVL